MKRNEAKMSSRKKKSFLLRHILDQTWTFTSNNNPWQIWLETEILLPIAFWCGQGCGSEGNIQGESKKMSVKEIFDFLTLKMLPLALALIKTKNRHLFDQFLKNPTFSMGNCLCNCLCKMHIFLPMGQKDTDFFVLINASAKQLMVTSLGLKNNTSS